MPRGSLPRAIRRPGTCCRVTFVLLAGLLVFPPAAAVLAQDVPLIQPKPDQRFAAHIADASQRFRIPEAWIRAILDAESAHAIRAVSDAGAMGLMQIMPDTWDELRKQHGLGDDPFDPRDNILAGAAYLREMLDRYDSIGAMLAAYNAGPGRYDEYVAIGRPLPAETQAYVAALAPLLGGEPLPGGVSTTPSPSTDWREAPLFVMPAGGGSPSGALQPDDHSDTGATAESPHDDDAKPPTSGSIFVARSVGDSEPSAPDCPFASWRTGGHPGWCEG